MIRYKVTIIPRGRALGVTFFLPEEDRYSYSKQRLESSIASLFGGRIAEELAFGPKAVTTGASNDIERATMLARNMVTKWGLSDKLGPLTYAEESGEVFLGRQVTQHKQVSDETAHVIDIEVRRVIDTAYRKAQNILETNRDKLDAMANALIKYETIDEKQIKDIMAGRAPKPPADWDDSVGTPPPKRTEGESEGGATIGSPCRPALSIASQKPPAVFAMSAATAMAMRDRPVRSRRSRGDGRTQRHPDSFSDGGRFTTARCRAGVKRLAEHRRRRRHHRHRR